MSVRRMGLALLSVCLCLVLCSCSNTGLQVTDAEPSVTLPPAEVPYAAPIGDAALEYTEILPLHLPRHDGLGLTTVRASVSFSPVRPKAENLVRVLLAQSNSAEATALGGSVRLSLYGTTPVEVSRDVVTINLSASALQLDREDLYIACQGIANTLTELSDIRYVNVLVVDKPVGVDIANTLPMGAFQRSSASDLGAVYRQTLSRRVSGTESAENKPFSANVPLYFPLPHSDGIVSEVRSLSFENQLLPDMVVEILRQLSLGPNDSSIDSPALPLLADLLTAAPAVVSTDEGSILTLDFAHNFADMLDAYDVSRELCASSLCATFTTFLPQISGIQITVDGDSAEPLNRSSAASLLQDYCTLYFPNEEMTELTPVLRPVSYALKNNPRSLLHELSLGPRACDSTQQVVGLMKEPLQDTAMLGFALSDQTLLVNFAPVFSEGFDEIGAQEERMLVYSLVNTLCMEGRIKSVCFFQSGSQLEGFTGEIYWAGLFYPLP